MEQKSVLIVEDDENVLDLFSLGLSDICDVKRATTGREGLAILLREAVGAVVLDYRLPDRTGLDVLSEIRSAHLHVPVIMVTGYGSESVCTSAFRLGVVDYLTKPVAILEFMSCVRRALAPSSGGDAAIGQRAATAYDPAPLKAAEAQPDLP